MLSMRDLALKTASSFLRKYTGRVTVETNLRSRLKIYRHEGKVITVSDWAELFCRVNNIPCSDMARLIINKSNVTYPDGMKALLCGSVAYARSSTSYYDPLMIVGTQGGQSMFHYIDLYSLAIVQALNGKVDIEIKPKQGDTSQILLDHKTVAMFLTVLDVCLEEGLRKRDAKDS